MKSSNSAIADEFDERWFVEETQDKSCIVHDQLSKSEVIGIELKGKRRPSFCSVSGTREAILSNELFPALINAIESLRREARELCSIERSVLFWAALFGPLVGGTDDDFRSHRFFGQ